MNLRQIEVFYSVMKAGSVSGAAKTLNVSQPNVTRILSHFESQLGFALFERVKGRLVPTPEAKKLMPQAEQLYSQLGMFQASTHRLQMGQSHVRIGTTPTLSSHIVTPVVAKQAKNEALTVDIITGHHTDLCEALLSNQLDFALALGAKMPAGIEAEAIVKRPMQVMTPSACGLMSNEATIALDKLDPATLIGLDPRDAVGHRFHQAIIDRYPNFRPDITVRSYINAAELASLGVGVAVVDYWSALPFRTSLTMHDLESLFDVSLTILSPSKEPLSVAARTMLEHIRNFAVAL
ncbi:LysR family transcriptional regulator [Thaumasiovibrio subtropicus]|uniref:LysR family transcriptional regulator n=1 Tax=Thaumasiovibrio subtropicus TaxID=1891207 RepID=UPI000B3560BB|nr:LysR family transcriptional regulator [Thaumasiovibrio subtropicus]